jgi:predicted ATPase
MAMLAGIKVCGFKSIAHTELHLRHLNVLIGANGAGKSNLLSLFRLLYEMRHGRLQKFVGDWGADALLFYGAKNTERIEASLRLEGDDNGSVVYRVELTPTVRGSLTPEETIEFHTARAVQLCGDVGVTVSRGDIGIAPESQLETSIETWRQKDADSQAAARRGEMVVQNIRRWGIFHLHDTSWSAPIRLSPPYSGDADAIRSDGRNLAAFLLKVRLSNAPAYRRIVETIRQVAPWFGDFVLERVGPEETDVVLNWRDRYSDDVFGPHQLPDGALRAMVLITLLLQPRENLPSLIVIDEPELGLHPAAITVIAALMKAVALQTQIVIATQSPTLLDEFDAADVIVVDRENGRSTFTRQDPERLKDWLEEYSLGELWQKNSIGGGPF